MKRHAEGVKGVGNGKEHSLSSLYMDLGSVVSASGGIRAVNAFLAIFKCHKTLLMKRKSSTLTAQIC